MRLLFAAFLCVALACTSSSTASTTPPPAVAVVVEVVPDAGTPNPSPPIAEEDPWLWLEEIESEKSLAWVKERNAASQKELESDPGYEPLRARLKSIYDSKERIPSVAVRNGALYNFWRDEAHPRGLWRRTTLAQFKKPLAATKWEDVLDLDALGVAEKKSYVWKGAICLPPKYERCLVSISVGGSDAAEVREFDTVKKQFVAGGFVLPAAKSEYAWKNLDTLLVGIDFGPGTLTSSGYPRQIREWKRGTKLADAKLVAEGDSTDVSMGVLHEYDHGKTRDWVYRTKTTFSDETWLLEGDKLIKIDKPDDAVVSAWNDQALVQLRSDWVINENIYRAGSLLATSMASLRTGKRDFTVLFAPQPNTSFDGFAGTKSALFIKSLEDVKTKYSIATQGKKGWEQKPFETQGIGSIQVVPWDQNANDDYFVWEEGFTSSSTLWLASIGKPKREVLKTMPAFFKSEGLVVTQHFATSKDGTKVPYFQVARKDLVLDGSSPTLLEGYGGFEISLTPFYDSTTGTAWLERGGVFVLANIRGGGEYGPSWHQAALVKNRQKAYDDFAAIAEDLIARKVTSAPKLGILGGSNGGLLTGVMLTQRPELFGAIVCLVPLLDMKRYHLLLAGASWMEEYGDPGKPDEWMAMKVYSPYQNVKRGKQYPRTFFATSTRDDRVHPGHARKMVARLLENGKDLLYFENTEGGHAAAADAAQRARLNAMAFTFLARQLGLK